MNTISNKDPLIHCIDGSIEVSTHYQQLLVLESICCELSSHVLNYVHVNILSMYLQVRFSTSIPLRATSNLIMTAGNKDCSDYILQQFIDNTLSFLIRLPQAGIYKFQVNITTLNIRINVPSEWYII